MKLVLLSALFFASSPLFAHPFTVCKNQNDVLGVHDLSFFPDPPLSGKQVSVTVKGNPSMDLTEGKIHVDVRVLGITVETQELELCEVLKCPIAAGVEFEATVVQDIPEGVPAHAGATVRLSLVNKDGKIKSCLESYVQIGGPKKKSEGLLGVEEDTLKKDLEFLYAKWKLMFPHAKHNFQVFGQNFIKIIAHNAKKESFTMAMNEFGSLTEEEFVRTRYGFRDSKSIPRQAPEAQVIMLRKEVSRADPPKEVDWTTRGVVSPVKNQGSCGSCWAFSAVGALESAYALKTGTLVEFSEQELVSCDDGDFGCQGGLMDTAFDWVQHSGGLCAEGDYSYTSGSTSARGECMKSTCTPVPGSVPKGYIDVLPNEAALLAAVTDHGPLSVAIEADQAVFQFYHSGVLTGACGTHLDHGVLLVGFGVDPVSKIPFWKVKNSWGGNWGESGYVRIQRGKRWPVGGECGINSKASFPIF